MAGLVFSNDRATVRHSIAEKSDKRSGTREGGAKHEVGINLPERLVFAVLMVVVPGISFVHRAVALVFYDALADKPQQ